MANKRMFSKQIVQTDAFLDMPVSAQLLYFHLNMEADDDGFVSAPKRIMKLTGCADDDLKILLAKRFLIAFESGVVVIKHWLIHNTIRKDRYIKTNYLAEKGTLLIKDNNSYTERQPVGNQLATQYRLDKNRLDKNREEREVADATPAQKAREFFENPEDAIQGLIAKGLPENQAKTEINKFISYWTEPTKSGSKQRWETEKTFEISRRLATWFSRIKDFNQINHIKL